MHSASGRFLSKLRSSMRARTLEHLTVAYVAIKKLAANAVIAGKSLADVDLGDVDDYLDELEDKSGEVT